MLIKNYFDCHGGLLLFLNIALAESLTSLVMLTIHNQWPLWLDRLWSTELPLPGDSQYQMNDYLEAQIND